MYTFKQDESDRQAMGSITIAGVIIIVVATALGSLHGSIRGIASFIGIYVAFMVTDRMAVGGATSTSYFWAFIGIFGGITLAGFLLYGATRMHLVDAFEGVFGAIAGFLVGWGLARFMMSYIVFYMPGTPLAAQILDQTSLAWSIYAVSPYQDFMNNPTVYNLRRPSF